MKRTYEVRDRADKRAIREFLKREGQFLLPMLELVEQTEVAIDEVIQVMGRATIEAVLEMSAEGVAGVKQAGRSRAEDDTVWYGRQGGVVYLSDRKVRVERPRLRRRGAGEGGEVEVPAYAAMRRPGAVADRMLEVLMAGVSTRKYGRVIGEMADTVGVSKSAVSRETVEASERVLKELMERRLDAWDLLVIYLDGIQMGSHHVLAAVGVDSDGKKHVLGVREGASENAEVTSALLEDLVERGLDPGRRRLFVIDGSKALRKAIEKVFGQRHPIQRCRNHKLRNVLGHLPKDQHPQVKAAFRAAMKLDAKQGEQKLEQLARWLERDHPSASASLREGLSEMFTINRLGLPPRLRKCLGSTNLIDSTHSGVRQKTRRVTNWKNGAMALRWAAASFVETEKSYRRIIGYDQLWMLRAHLDDHEPVAEMRKAQKTRRVTNWKNGAMALRWAAASFVETEKSYRRIIGYDQLWMLRAHLDDHDSASVLCATGCRNEKGRLTRRLSGATTFNCQRDTIQRRIVHPAEAAVSGPRLVVRFRGLEDARRACAEAADSAGRAHEGVPGDRGGSQDPLARRARGAGRSVRPTRASRVSEVGQRTGVQRETRAAVVGARGRRDALYRAGQPVGERLQRELQRQAQGRAVERGDLLLVGGGGRAGRAMEARVQYRPTPQRLRRLSPGP